MSGSVEIRIRDVIFNIQDREIPRIINIAKEVYCNPLNKLTAFYLRSGGQCSPETLEPFRLDDALRSFHWSNMGL
ncbi:hypothetical protein TNCV_3315401 [Trichonephila clavipes]|nr:hypothetical protein TNCV_3315401 [Trichonephila clavipes]